MATAAAGQLVALFAPIGTDKAPFIGRVGHTATGQVTIYGSEPVGDDGEGGNDVGIVVDSGDFAGTWWDIDDPSAHPNVPKVGDIIQYDLGGVARPFGSIYAIVQKVATITIVAGDPSPFTGPTSGEVPIVESLLQVQALLTCNGVPQLNDEGMKLTLLFTATTTRISIAAAGVGLGYATIGGGGP